MKKCKNISTYLKTDCWKPQKVPLTLAHSKNSIIPVVYLSLFATFFCLDLFEFSHCNAACLWLSTTSAFPSFFSFLSPNILLFFSPSIFLGIPSVFEIQASQFWIIYINIYTINLRQMKLYSWYNHSSTTSKNRKSIQKVFR